MKTNLAQQPTNDNADYLVGDVVVYIDSNKPEQLMTVHRVQEHSVLMDGNRKFALKSLVRHASVAELNAKKRLGECV